MLLSVGEDSVILTRDERGVLKVISVESLKTSELIVMLNPDCLPTIIPKDVQLSGEDWKSIVNVICAEIDTRIPCRK